MASRRWVVRRRSRLERAERLQVAEGCWAAGQTQRQVAADVGVARSTLQDWHRADRGGAAPAALAAFVATPEGVQWLHQLVLAAQWVITLQGGAGVRVVCQFLELTGLSAFVGASYGTQQALNAALEEAIVTVAQEQRAALATGMPHRQVTVVEDETFHPHICLVGLEPVSNFILLEQYAQDRTAATWTAALQAALTGLAVEVIQGTSDEAKALRRHVAVDWDAHHSPDLFHGQHEIAKATSLPLARAVEQAAATWTAAQARGAAVETAAPPPPLDDRWPTASKPHQAALTDLAQAQVAHAAAQSRQTEARALLRELGDLYHPYDLATGQAQPVARVAQRFADVWTRLHHVAEAADLAASARERLAKAQRLTTQWLATIAFFFATLHLKVEALALPPDLETALVEQLIPALYLERVAARHPRAEDRHRLRTLSHHLLEPLRQPDHPLQALPPADRQRIEPVAGECADLFQRSSSAVEGRNGQLALHHHGHHRLSDRKLAALTALHNFHSRRPDGTTAAERFFGRAPEPLFEQVLARVPLPPRPARRRPRPPKVPYLMPVAA